MRFDIITIFPNLFSSYLEETIIARALRKKILRVNLVDLRKFAKAGDSHRSVDNRPYGGGPGMILMVEPIYKALRALKIRNRRKTRVVMLAPEGKQFTQREAERLSTYDRLVLLCGRYEGFDARVEKLIDEKISIGPYVLAGGELPAVVVLEAVARHIPGVVGHPEALKEETFSKDLDYVEYPQYTRPEKFCPQKGKCWRVPKILLSGNHAAIRKWRAQYHA
ncbi:MAG: tRNA (guanosine(37)-N1)-methyltransferase TrmD [Patescibacteria group bacterium]|nr:tRNA (guanosine(37)-N1)-methyltransferase TrmD [Patescibacteria group bacterium]